MKTKPPSYKDALLSGIKDIFLSGVKEPFQSGDSWVYLFLTIFFCLLIDQLFRPTSPNRYPNRANFVQLLTVFFPVILVFIKRIFNINWLFIWLSVPIFSFTFLIISLYLSNSGSAGSSMAYIFVLPFGSAFMIPFAALIFAISTLFPDDRYTE
jgi:membrane-associated HD superfamily phosphohydrolase